MIRRCWRCDVYKIACQYYAIAAYFACCRVFCIFSKVRLLRIFPHKLAFSTAILILFVFLLPLSIMFCYLDRLVANKMAPSMCPDPCGTRWGSWFQAVLYHISAYFHHIFGVYAVCLFFFRKCRIKLTCLTRSAGVIHCFTLSLSWLSRVSAFYPRDATLAWVLAMAPCLCLCLSQVSVLACLSVSVTSRCFTQVS